MRDGKETATERLNNLEQEVRAIKEYIGGLGRSVNQLLCPHNDIEFLVDSGVYRKRCKECGMVLEIYPSKLKMLQAKFKYLEKHNKELIVTVEEEIEQEIGKLKDE